MNKYKHYLFLLLLAAYTSCGIYSLTGTATTADTIQIDLFFNNTDLGPANLAVNFTNNMKDYFQQNSSLSVVSEEGELHLEGTITRYDLSPQAPTSSPTTGTSPAAQTRLTITVKMNYVDNLVPENSFKDKTFSFYDQFSSEQDFETVREEMEERIFDQIYLDVFNRTVANW